MFINGLKKEFRDNYLNTLMNRATYASLTV